AHAVGPVVDARQSVVDGLQLVAVAVGEDEVDLAIARVAGEIVGVHALVLVHLTPLMQIRLHAAQELRGRVLEGLARLFQERLAHFPSASEGRRIYGVGPGVSTAPSAMGAPTTSPPRSYTSAAVIRTGTRSPGAASPRTRTTPSIPGACCAVRPSSVPRLRASSISTSTTR